MHHQVDFIVAVSNGDAAASLFPQIRSLFQLSGFRDGFNRVIGTTIAGEIQVIQIAVATLTDAPTTSAPTFNVDATLGFLEMTYTSTGNPIRLVQAGNPGEAFKSEWFSYGAMKLAKTNESESIDLSWVPSSEVATARIVKRTKGEEDLDLGTIDDGAGLGGGRTNISIGVNTQTTLHLYVTNWASNVKVEYDLTIIRPFPNCEESQLTDW